MNEALKDYMKGFDLMGYRLRDGSHIIANEDHYDSAHHAFYVSAAVQVNISNDGKAFFSPWLITGDEEQIRILNTHIIASAPPVEDIKIQYHRYIISSNLHGALTKKEIGIILDQLFYDELDNLDNTEIDGGMFDEYTSLEPKTLEWRKQWKPYDN